MLFGKCNSWVFVPLMVAAFLAPACQEVPKATENLIWEEEISPATTVPRTRETASPIPDAKQTSTPAFEALTPDPTVGTEIPTPTAPSSDGRDYLLEYEVDPEIRTGS
jgi:hypothetical protein